MSVPALILAGKKVHPCERSLDAEFILYEEEGELEWDWREVLAPISLFGEQEFEKFHPQAKLEDELARLGRIKKWMDNRGPSVALSESPLIGIWEKGQLSLADGWHRLKLAVEEYGLQEVTAIVGIRPAE